MAPSHCSPNAANPRSRLARCLPFGTRLRMGKSLGYSSLVTRTVTQRLTSVSVCGNLYPCAFIGRRHYLWLVRFGARASAGGKMTLASQLESPHVGIDGLPASSGRMSDARHGQVRCRKAADLAIG